MDNKWLFQLLLCTLLLFYISTFRTTTKLPQKTVSIHESKSVPRIPKFAYLIAGTKGDLNNVWRLLHAIYHPRNIYLLHLDLVSPLNERVELDRRVKSDVILGKTGNVHVIVESNMVTYRGPTMVAAFLHGGALLLKMCKHWDWFINLSASDYPLVTQDDMLYVFSSLPRNINFVEHTSHLGWKEENRARPLIIDPGLHSANKSDPFLLKESRELPTAFKLFTGSAWVVLTRDFMEYCVIGYENLPRTLLMYYTNFISSSEGYFQTVICNSPKYSRTVVNHDLHYIKWDWPPQQHPRILTLKDKPKMIRANVPFARKFEHGNMLLDLIDFELLGWRNESFVPGAWCEGTPKCSEVGDVTRLKPGKGAGRLAVFMSKVVRGGAWKNQCK